MAKELVRVCDDDASRRRTFEAIAKRVMLPAREWDDEWARIREDASTSKNDAAFEVPLPLAADLCHFLDVPVGTWMPRPRAIDLVRQRLRERGLVRRRIEVDTDDSSVRMLLGVKKSTPQPVMLFHLDALLDPFFLV
jgi:transposase